MKIPNAYEVNEVCKKAMKEYAQNYDKCIIACMSDKVLIGMKELIDKEIRKRGINDRRKFTINR